ncbi:MAG: ATP-binding cassette domain-containing protein [Polyangiaceae bacterium]
MIVDPVLRVKDLTLVRGGKTVVRSITLDARAGEVLGLLGPSGAGKSTIFRAIAGDVAPTSGTMDLGGVALGPLALWQRARLGLGYIPQTPSVLWDFDVASNLRAFEKVVGGRVDDEHVRARARSVDLEAKWDVRASALSAGERRRLEFARAVTRKPKLLLCDEPFAGVDPVGASRLGDLLRGLADAGTAVVLADHHVDEALRICDRALLVLDGAVAVEGTPDAFRAHPVVRGRYLGPNLPESAGRWPARAHGLPADEVKE